MVSFEMRFLGYFIMNNLFALFFGVSFFLGSPLHSLALGAASLLFGVFCLKTVFDEVFGDE